MVLRLYPIYLLKTIFSSKKAKFDLFVLIVNSSAIENNPIDIYAL